MISLNLPSLARLLSVCLALLACVANAQTPLSGSYFGSQEPPAISYGLSSIETADSYSSPSSQSAYPAYQSTPVEPAFDYADVGYASDVCPACDACPNWGYHAFFGYDSWRGPPDDGWGNNGLHTGVNLGTRLGPVSDLTGIGFQIGGSFGVYNWNGTDYHLSHNDEATPQGFVTYGFFRKPTEHCNWTAAIVQDWMLNSNYGVFAENPTLSQWRGQVGYCFNGLNEVGLWGAFRGQGDSRNVPGFGSTRWEAIQQLNAYWHYKWGAGGPNTSVWFGVPENYRLSGQGSVGDYLAGALTVVPLSERFQLYALVTYMHPSASPGPPGSNDEAWCFFTGVSFLPGKNARTNGIGGDCWMPMMQLANNGYFLVDQDPTY